MSTTKSGVRTFDELSAALQARAGQIKAAAQKKTAAENDPVPEKDLAEKGQAAIPKDPDAVPAKQNTPESKTNEDGVTKVYDAPPVADRVKDNDKIAADLTGKAAKVAAGIKDLAAKLTKRAEKGGRDLPQMPPNDKKNEGEQGTGGVNKPPSGGSGQPGDKAVTEVKSGGSAVVSDGPDKEKKVDLPKGDDKGELPADPKNTDKTADENKTAAEGKSAGEEEIPLDASFHIKLSQIILSTEEGRQFAHAQIEKYHGAQAANDIIKAASLMEEKAIELQELEESGALLAEEMWKSASEDERANIIKLAEVLTAGRDRYETDAEKQAYDAGAAAAAQMGDAGMLDQESPENLDGAIMAALDEMVQSGEITPEMAAEILQALEQGGAGGEGGEGGPEGAMLEGEMPPEKEASTKSASNFDLVSKMIIETKPEAKTEPEKKAA